MRPAFNVALVISYHTGQRSKLFSTNWELTSKDVRSVSEHYEMEVAMTIEMLVGGFLILMMVAVIVVSMTSTKSSNVSDVVWKNLRRKGFGADPRGQR